MKRQVANLRKGDVVKIGGAWKRIYEIRRAAYVVADDRRYVPLHRTIITEDADPIMLSFAPWQTLRRSRLRSWWRR